MPQPLRLLEVRESARRLRQGRGGARISLEVVAPGTIVTVIGPNGAGKTTLLAAMMGLLPSRGEMRYLGVAAHRADGRAARRARADPRPRAARAVRGDERGRQPGARRAFSARASGERGWRDAEEVYQRFPRLQERRDQLAGTLSGGERQMLAMGRALMGKPRLLMLDEPSLGLAPLIVREIFSIIAELRATGVSILLVEQNARAALQVADYGYVLETGELAIEGGAGPRGESAGRGHLSRQGRRPNQLSDAPGAV